MSARDPFSALAMLAQLKIARRQTIEIKGERGDKGEPGAEGKQGAPGRDGKDGAGGRDGKDGARGERGDKGDQGRDGRDGKDGKNGRDGKDGKDGADGKPGLRWRGIYETGVTYDEDDAVELEGSSWIARRRTANMPGLSRDWDLLARRGAPGAGGGVPVGTLGIQNADAVAITGGTVAGVGVEYFETLYNFLGATPGFTANAVVLGGGAGSALQVDAAGLSFDPATNTMTLGGPLTSSGAYINLTNGYYVSAGAGNVIYVDASNGAHLAMGSAIVQKWGASAGYGSQSVSIARAGDNALAYGGATSGAGAATSRTEINKAITAITDAVAKATFTVTIPNGAHSASLKVKLVGSLGAGGAIGANEASQSVEYHIDIARTAGANAVATIGAAIGQPASAAVSGAATVAVSAALSAISGAAGATNTFTVDVTVTKSGGSSDSHTCLCYGQLVNANASGVTIA